MAAVWAMPTSKVTVYTRCTSSYFYSVHKVHVELFHALHEDVPSPKAAPEAAVEIVVQVSLLHRRQKAKRLLQLLGHLLRTDGSVVGDDIKHQNNLTHHRQYAKRLLPLPDPLTRTDGRVVGNHN